MRPYFRLAILNPVTLFSGEYQGVVVLHIYAISAPSALMWLRRLPARYVKKGDFGNQNYRPIFCVQVGPMGIHADAKFGNSSLSVF